MSSGLTQERVVQRLDKLTSLTANFPSLIHEAEAMSIINRIEKDVILGKYKSVYDKLTTFYLLAGSKGTETLAKLPELLELTGNETAVSVLLQEDDVEVEAGGLDLAGQEIIDNLERLCSHTVNPSLVLSFATGLELITGMERELLSKECRSEEDQLEAFYTLVATKGQNAIQNLIQVLKMTNNYWALQVLHYQEQE